MPASPQIHSRIWLHKAEIWPQIIIIIDKSFKKVYEHKKNHSWQEKRCVLLPYQGKLMPRRHLLSSQASFGDTFGSLLYLDGHIFYRGRIFLGNVLLGPKKPRQITFCRARPVVYFDHNICERGHPTPPFVSLWVHETRFFQSRRAFATRLHPLILQCLSLVWPGWRHFWILYRSLGCIYDDSQVHPHRYYCQQSFQHTLL